MEFAKSFNLFGVEGKEIPCITGKGTPTAATKGAVGCLYMDENTGYTYRCTAAANGAYTWTSTDKSFAELKDVFVVDHARLDELVAMRSENIGNSYGYVATDVEFAISSNGVFAGIGGRVIGKTVSPGYASAYKIAIPDAYRPFDGTVMLYKDDSMRIMLSVADNAAQTGSLVVVNDTAGDLTITEKYFDGSYALRDVVVSEVGDIRVGYDGRTYASAGEAVRSIGRSLQKASELYTKQNLIDKSNTTPGYLSNGSVLSHTENVITDYIEVDYGETYSFLYSYKLYGTSFKRSVEAYDTNKNYIGNGNNPSLSGIEWQVDRPNELTDVAVGVIRCTNKNTKYIRITIFKNSIDSAMLVPGDTYPEEYREYGYTLNNIFRLNDTAKAEIAKMLHGSVSPLYGKTAVFDGDSIGSGGSAGDGLNGWAGRIGANNAMAWENYAIGGGTITQQGSNHCIGANIDTIHSEYPTLDYLILEGGTNDADLLKEAGLGTFSETDYRGNYDTTTFSGAFETLLYKAVTYYPTAKIGYIVAHRMDYDSSIRRMYFDRAVELCQKWGVPYIDLWKGASLNRFLSAHYDSSLDSQGNIDAGKLYTDGQHLTPAGYEVLTPKIEAWMKTL